MKNKFFTLLLAVMASVGTMFAQSGTSTIADIYNMEQGAAITLGAFDVVYVASLQNGANIYIKDATGSIVIYKPSYGLQAGDHVEAGMEGTVNIYHGLYEIAPLSAKEDLTITSGEAPAPMEAVEVPTMANVNQYVVYKNVSFASDTAFVEGRRHTVLGVWNNQEVSFYNQYYIGATLKADKTYNIVAVNTVYGTTLQAYPLSVEEVGKPNSNTITIAEAIEIGMALDSMATSTETYTIEGYVINAGTFSEQYKTQSWYMADDKNATTSSFQAYRCYPIYGKDTVAVTNGNKVRMTGKLQKYYNRSTASYLVEMTRVPATILDSQEEIETITVAQAMEIGSTLESMAVTEKEYIIKGYVSNIITPYDTIYKNETFFITDVKGARTNDKTQAFEIYRGKPNTEKEIGLDALIQIKCKIKNFKGIIENESANQSFEVLEQGQGVEDDTPTPCITASGTCGENLTWELSCEGVLTISGTGAMDVYKNKGWPWTTYKSSISSVVIKEGVTNIEAFSFHSCNSLTSIEIPNSVVSIGNNVFYLCTNLTSIEIPNSVTSIGDNAFFDCNRLTSVKLGNSLTTIGSSAFENCFHLTSIEIPNSVISIGDNAFVDCESLESIIIPDGITKIEFQTFAGCSNLISVTIPNSVTSIGSMAFSACYSLNSIEIPSSVTSIEDNAFRYCRKLTSVTNYAIEPQLIGADVFYDINISSCTLYVPAQSLEAYKAADVWKEFGNILPIEGTGVLYRDTIFVHTLAYTCPGEVIYAGRPVMILNDTTWTDTVSSIIYGLGVMDSIITFHVFTLRIPESLSIDQMKAMDIAPTLVQGKPLDVATSNALLTQYYRNMSYQEEYAFIDTVYWAEPVYKSDGSLDDQKEAPLDLTSPYTSNDLEDTLLLVIMHECDRTCIPYIFPIEETPCNTVSGTCGNNLTWELTCDSVLTISGTGAMWNLTEEQGWKPYKESIKVVILPEGLDSIAPKAFYQCVNLTSVNLPNSVLAVGNKAFYDCEKIAEPVYNDRIFALLPSNYSGTYSVPEGIVSIAAYAFGINLSIKEIVLPSSLKSLGVNSLGGALSLKKLTCYATIPPVCDPVVFGFYLEEYGIYISIEDMSIPVYVPAASVEAYKAADQWKEFFNIQAIPTDPQDANMEVVYIDPSNNEIQREAITLHLPAAPTIEGFTFLKWQVVAGDLEDAIFIQAVYTENDPQFAPAVYTNPANPTQKLIRNGNVYILTGDKVYTITGQAMK